MKHVLEPLAHLPGVRIAALVTPDGVPMCAQNPARPRSSQGDDELGEQDVSALAALATGWLGEISRAVAPLSWDVPHRLVLRAARGTLVVVQAPGALLLAVLEGGMQPEELRLPMESAIARMQRHVRGIERRGAAPRDGAEPPGVLPRREGRGAGGPEVPQVPQSIEE